jgi:hypothetical protein
MIGKKFDVGFFFFVKGYVDIVRLLLKHGAKVEETNENGHTPLVKFFRKTKRFFLIFIFFSDGSSRWRSCRSDSSST